MPDRSHRSRPFFASSLPVVIDVPVLGWSHWQEGRGTASREPGRQHGGLTGVGERCGLMWIRLIGRSGLTTDEDLPWLDEAVLGSSLWDSMSCPLGLESCSPCEEKKKPADPDQR